MRRSRVTTANRGPQRTRAAEATVACADCGAIQRIPQLAPYAVASCRRCGRFLDRGADPALLLRLGWAAAVVVLLLPANLLPLVSTSAVGHTRYAYIASSVSGLWGDGWPVLGLLLGAFTVALPLLWAGAITVVLGLLAAGRRPPWLGPLYRYARSLRLWAMPDVLALAGFVIYMRAAQHLAIHVEGGGWCLLGAGLLVALMPAVAAPHAVWRAIAPARRAPAGAGTLACRSCEQPLPRSAEGDRCPRCGERLRMRKLDSLSRTAALVTAGYLLYFPAYYYPMGYTVRPDGVVERTIIDGMRELFRAGYWYLGLIILVASVLIPLLKLVGLTWLLASVGSRSARHLALKSRLHRLIHRVGRWSNVDPLIVALSVPVMSFDGLVQVHAARAALPFELVVSMTMLASRSFDARLLWDAAEAAR